MRIRHARAALILSSLILATATGCGSATYGSSGSGGGGSSGGVGGGSGGAQNGGGLSGIGGGSGGAVGGQTAPPGAGDNTCIGEFNPKPSGIAPGASVKATLFTECADTPIKHDLEMRLQRFSMGGWRDEATKDIPRIPGPDPYPNLITAPCVPGRWRLVISIDGTSHTDIPWTVNVTGAEREIKPDECG